MKLFLTVALACAAVQGLNLQAIVYGKRSSDELPPAFIVSNSNPLSTSISYAPGAATPAPTTAAPATTGASTTVTPSSTSASPTTTIASATTSGPTTTKATTTSAPATTTGAPATTTAAPASTSKATDPPVQGTMDLFAILKQAADDADKPGNDQGSTRKLDTTEGVTYFSDSNKNRVADTRRLTEADLTIGLLFCNSQANTIQSYTSKKPSASSSSSIQSISGSKDADSEGKCYDYTVKTETLTVAAGCNGQNSKEGCGNLYNPGCGGLSIDPKSNQLYVARTGGRTIGKFSYVSAGGQCSGRVLDWLIRYRGKKFNGPSDITFLKNGNFLFSDSPFALAATQTELLSPDLKVLDSKRELPFNGVYLRTQQGTTELIDCTMTRPKSIALSPDQDVAYVTNADAGSPIIKAFKLLPNGTKECARTFFNFKNNTLKVDGLATGKTTCLRQYPTSIQVDSDGFVYAVMCNNIYTFNGAGELIGRMEFDREIYTISFGNGRIIISSENNLFALPQDPSFSSSLSTETKFVDGCSTGANNAANTKSNAQAESTSSGTGTYAAVGGSLAVAAVGLFVMKRKQNKTTTAAAAPQPMQFLQASTPSPVSKSNSREIVF